MAVSGALVDEFAHSGASCGVTADSVGEPRLSQQIIGAQLVLTLDDPSTRNAVSDAMARQLIRSVRELDTNSELRVGIITGAGETFSSGANLNDRTVHATSDVREHVPRRQLTVFDRVARCSKPIIAAINGPAVGAGANLALACDLRVCADDAWLHWPQAKLGVLPGSGTLARLCSTVGVSRALEWTLACTKVSADEGRQSGLYNRTAPREELLQAALELGAAICDSAPLSVRFIKESLSFLVQSQADKTADADAYRSFILYNTREREKASEEWRRNKDGRQLQSDQPPPSDQ